MTMNIIKNLLAGALSLAILGSVANAAEVARLMPAAQGDLVASRLSVEKAALPVDAERAPVDFAWAIDPADSLFASAPFTAESREFWTDLDAAEMRKGYAFATTAPGALVRISPAGDTKAAAPLRASDIALRINGREVSAGTAIRVAADAAQLKAAGVDFPEGTLAFRLSNDFGAGQVEMKIANATGRYLVHVFEPDSPLAMDLRASNDKALAGGSLVLTAKIANDGAQLQAESIGGVVTSPDGKSFNVRFKREDDGQYRAKVALPEGAGNGLALWEAHTFAVTKVGGALVPRDAKTSFAVSLPTAKLGSQANVDTTRGVQVSLPVEAASTGRYEVRGVLFGTAQDGSMKPFAVGHAARWLEPGKAMIELNFGKELVPAGIGAPFELREVSLNDQTRLGQLETRSVALRFGSTK